MPHLKHWSDSQINGIFEALDLKEQANPNQSTPKHTQKQNVPVPKQVYLPRLSNSSVPPTTGKTPNANLEKTIK